MVIRTDFLVIGSGIAGLNFALEASSYGEVTIVTKKEIFESNTNYAQGGIAAVLEKTDSYDKHIADTLDAGAFHNDKKAVEIMVKEGPALVRKLAEIGVPFAMKDNGDIELTKEGGHSKRRIAFCGDATGAEIEKTLVEKVKQNQNIVVLEHTFVAELIKHNEEVVGVFGFDSNKKNIKYIYARVVILASGGAGQIYYPHTTNPEISTGDGVAMGLLVGAKVKDLEFFQFHPTALFKKGLPTFLLSESLRGEGALLRNFELDLFMDKYDSRKELAPRDIVARAIFNEEKRGPVYLDMRHFKASLFKDHFKKIYETLRNYGIDPKNEVVPISPAAHYTIGGIQTDLLGYTGVKRLYAFGEVACTGVHGANRLGSNSLLEALVFSQRICEKLSELKKNKLVMSREELNFNFQNIVNLPEIRRIRDVLSLSMWQYAGIVRTEKGLKEGMKRIKELKNEIIRYESLNEFYFETRNMILVSEQVLKAALKRKDSLGAHFRES